MSVKAIHANKLFAKYPAEKIIWADSKQIPLSTRRLASQPRALQALELALNIHNSAYNVYLCGGANLGRTYFLKRFLTPKLKKLASPPDLLYVNNFEDLDKPILIKVPAGQGKQIKLAMQKALLQIRKELMIRIESNSFVKKRGALLDRFQSDRAKVMREMEGLASGQGFQVDVDEQGTLTLYPLVEGKRLAEEEFEKLDQNIRNKIKSKGDQLLRNMTDFARRLTKTEKAFRDDERVLEKELISQILERYLNPVTERFMKNVSDPISIAKLDKYFSELCKDILENPEPFFPREMQNSNTEQMIPVMQGEPILFRYDINLFVDNSGLAGAPLIIDDHPTQSNLLGSIERESEMGALVTDFTLIKAGSLHKANGGFLVLHIDDLIHQVNSWEGLLRALRSGKSQIEDISEISESPKIKGIEPEALDLDLKVILIGDAEIYESIYEHDDRFCKLFKIKAQLADATERTSSEVRNWLHQAAEIIEDLQLLTFTKEALASLVDYGSYLCEDQRKLSLKFPLIRELMIEASAFASQAKKKVVDKCDIDQALASRNYRLNLVEELFLEEYDRDLLKIQSSGVAIGRINALSVTWLGDFEIGLPHQISCIVGVGHGGIIDLEREAELGGPIHTKAMMILKSYLVSQFARKKPLVLTGSLCFEQNYAGVEGDSASGAELAALLSAISEVPLKMSLAFTGAVNQAGQIMAVGGLTRKIEGFFDICSRRGLSGDQGVIIPYDNVEHLLLKTSICEAVEKNLFAIYPVKHIDEALELLTGLNTGKLLKNGNFSPNSLYALVDKRLKEFGWYAENSFKGRRSRKND